MFNLDVSTVSGEIDFSTATSVSEVLDFIHCPQYWANKYVFQRQEIAPIAKPLRVGTAVHEVLEQFMLGRDKLGVDPVSTRLTEPEDDLIGEVMDLLMDEWYGVHVLGQPKWTAVISTEEPLALYIGGHLVVGTPDAVVEYNGKLWHVQHKTLAQSKPVATFIKLVARSYHEALYHWMLRAKFPDREIGGTMLNIVRKMSRKRAQEDPTQGLWLEWLAIDNDKSARALKDLTYYLDLMADQREILDTKRHRDMPFVPQNRKMCAGTFGNSLCTYYHVCQDNGQILWDDRLFQETDPHERYDGKSIS